MCIIKWMDLSVETQNGETQHSAAWEGKNTFFKFSLALIVLEIHGNITVRKMDTTYCRVALLPVTYVNICVWLFLKKRPFYIELALQAKGVLGEAPCPGYWSASEWLGI